MEVFFVKKRIENDAFIDEYVGILENISDVILCGAAKRTKHELSEEPANIKQYVYSEDYTHAELFQTVIMENRVVNFPKFWENIEGMFPEIAAEYNGKWFEKSFGGKLENTAFYDRECALLAIIQAQISGDCSCNNFNRNIICTRAEYI